MLQNRAVGLEPKGMAPMTKGKSEMRRRSLGEVEQYLNELLEEHSLPFDFDLDRITDVWNFVKSDFKGVRDLRSRVIEWLKGAGAQRQGRYTKQDGTGRPSKIGRASCRARVCQYVSISVVAVPYKKKYIAKNHYSCK